MEHPIELVASNKGPVVLKNRTGRFSINKGIHEKRERWQGLIPVLIMGKI
jgi:hypothetical protein